MFFKLFIAINQLKNKIRYTLYEKKGLITINIYINMNLKMLKQLI